MIDLLIGLLMGSILTNIFLGVKLLDYWETLSDFLDKRDAKIMLKMANRSYPDHKNAV